MRFREQAIRSLSYLFVPALALCLPASLWAAQLHITPSKLSPGDVGWCRFFSREAESATLIWKDERIPLVGLEKPGAFGAFLAVPQNKKPGGQTLEVVYVSSAGDKGHEQANFSVLAKDFPVQKLTLPKNKVSPDKKSLERHRRERTAVLKVLASSTDKRLWKSPFQAPVKGAVISPFGVRRVLNGQPRSSHSGVDLRGRAGTPVGAASDGVVVLTGDHFFAGKSVYVDHGMGLVTMYFHLSAIQVKTGDPVHAGQTIGLVGSTGRSTGPHLHWGLRVHNCPADPLTLLALFPLPQ